MATESEITIYARITDFSGLGDVFEHHEQCSIKSPKGNGAVRVRKTTKDGEDQYVLTTKVKRDNGITHDNIECNKTIDLKMYDEFKQLCTDMMVKDRFVFPLTKLWVTINGEKHEYDKVSFLQYEVDVFLKEDGSYYEWCKIDVEVQHFMRLFKGLTMADNIELLIKVSDLPFKPVQAFVGNHATTEQKALLDSLYSEVFLRKI